MVKMSRTLAVLGVLAAVLGGPAAAETYHLGTGGEWQNVAGTPEGEYLLAVSKIKQQIMSGSQKEVVEALEQLKTDFPELAGASVDSFIAAERLYADGALGKAAAQYKRFMNTYPDSVLYPVALERLYSIGTAFLQGQKRTFIKVLHLPAFDDGVDIMWDIAERRTRNGGKSILTPIRRGPKSTPAGRRAKRARSPCFGWPRNCMPRIQARSLTPGPWAARGVIMRILSPAIRRLPSK